MQRVALMVCYACISICIIGCGSSAFQTLFPEQKWSENYCLADGVGCTAPEMVDGDINTTGRTAFPERVHGRTVYGNFPNAETEVILPEKKSIRKIVICSKELESFDVLACIGEKEEWKLIEEFDKNTEKKIVIRTSVFTDRIKIRTRPKSSFAGISSDVVDGRMVTLRRATMKEPEIQEIELYGFESAGSDQSQKSDSDKDMKLLFQ